MQKLRKSWEMYVNYSPGDVSLTLLRSVECWPLRWPMTGEIVLDKYNMIGQYKGQSSGHSMKTRKMKKLEPKGAPKCSTELFIIVIQIMNQICKLYIPLVIFNYLYVFYKICIYWHYPGWGKVSQIVLI